MNDKATAKLFMHGRSQAVRLPKEFRLPGKEVRVRRVGSAVVLEPIGEPFDMAAWSAKLDSYRDVPFMSEGSPEQPPMPIDDRKYFDDE
jgi:antitoxin VapB